MKCNYLRLLFVTSLYAKYVIASAMQLRPFAPKDNMLPIKFETASKSGATFFTNFC